VGATRLGQPWRRATHSDYQIGRIVETIEQTGEFDNTLIIYIAGDNGPTPEGGLHGIMNKADLLERRRGVA
jgi:arylsulfatase A-like enzyme